MAAATNKITPPYALRNIYDVYGVVGQPTEVCVKPKARDYHWLKYQRASIIVVVSSSSSSSAENDVFTD